LVVRGTRTALPKHGWRFGRSDAEVRVLEPIGTTGLGSADVESLKERVFERIAQVRREMEEAATPVAAS
jgi:1-acyl-sn-glycerol-3-phosphate acyltransferase